MLNNLLPTIGFAGSVRATGYLILGALVIANVLVKPRIPGRSKRPAHMQFPAPDMKAIITHKAYLLTIAGGFIIMWGICAYASLPIGLHSLIFSKFSHCSISNSSPKPTASRRILPSIRSPLRMPRPCSAVCYPTSWRISWACSICSLLPPPALASSALLGWPPQVLQV
jgi:hypothetical protein